MVIERQAALLERQDGREDLEVRGSSFLLLLPTAHILCHLVNFLIYSLSHDMFSERLQWVGHMGALRTRIQTLSPEISEFKAKQKNHHKTM